MAAPEHLASAGRLPSILSSHFPDSPKGAQLVSPFPDEETVQREAYAKCKRHVSDTLKPLRTWVPQGRR